MDASRLRTLVLVIWGLIILLCGGMSIWAFNNPEIKAGFAANSLQGGTIIATTPSPISFAPTPKVAQVVYLPSATARYATEMPTTPTPTFGQISAAVQYSLTLPADFDPFTGLQLANSSILNRRPVAVKISTFPREMVRPLQSGLSMADVVYEYYIEDELTRFIAVFYSKDAQHAGPVRSGRYFDEHIMRMYHSVLVYGYADKRVQNHLENSDLLPLLFLERPSVCPPLCPNNEKNAEVRLFVDTSGVGAKISNNSRQNLRASLFGTLILPSYYPEINRVYTHYSKFSYNYWEYDSTLKVYKRFSDLITASGLGVGEVYTPHIDHLNNTQVTADNVVELIVPHVFHNEFDREDQVFDIKLTGTGEAYLFREGRMVKAFWVRDRIDQPIQLVDVQGNPIPMKAGVTFYQVINPESSIEQSGTDVSFYFFIPPRHVTPTTSPWTYAPLPSRTPRH